MKYDFKTLSPADFEDLIRDLVSAELKIRFEGFGPGPDGGIDGRHAENGAKVILQAKHKASSNFASLRSVMKKERKAIDRLQPKRYILATSQQLTPLRKSQLAEIIGKALKTIGDILGCTDLNAMLHRHPSIEESHIKLWLSSTPVLKRLLRSSAFAYTAASREDMLDNLRVFVSNPSFPAARKILEKQHVLIVSGPPGVGKTTLAQMLAYAYVGEEWEFIAVKNLDEEFSEVQDTKKQMFFFDDFLGKISLDRKALAAKDAILAQFIRRIQRSKNARFILTTRAYIYEEARSVSESIGDPRLDISKYVLDVGIYTRRVRARILYNHIVASSISSDYIRALVEGDSLPAIIDHPNYNPRIIEWMTAPSLLVDVLPHTYAEHFMRMLDHPKEIWDRAFREHIPAKAQHLLISLYFLSEYGANLEELQSAFQGVHARLCSTHNLGSAPTDFHDGLKLLEGSFLSIRNRTVSFVNPSVRDYLKEYLSDVSLLADLAPTSSSARWAQGLWQHYKDLETRNPVLPSRFVTLFGEVAKRFKDFQAWRRPAHKQGHLERDDLALSERIKLLGDWLMLSKDQGLARCLQDLVFNPADSFSPWLDGMRLPKLIAAFRSGEWMHLSMAEEIAEQLEVYLIRILEDAPPSDDLDNIRETIDNMDSDDVSEKVRVTLRDAINCEVENTPIYVEELDAETELRDYSERLLKLAKWACVDASSAINSVNARLKVLKDENIEVEKATFPTGIQNQSDNFDDMALKHLFEGLLHV